MNSRRKFLGSTAAGLLVLGAPILANARLALPEERRLKLYNLHTGERVTATYWADGQYQPDELTLIYRLMRDHRTGSIESIDKRLLNQLYQLQQKLDSHGAYHIISGYRSPKTNARLHNATSGVAKRSLHMQGRAADIRLPGVDLKHLRKAALSLRSGGVGYYPRSNFIHVDTGRPRFW